MNGHDWLLDAAALLGEPDPGPTPWLVDGLIVDHAIVAFVGRWKTLKSYALLHLCISIASGDPAFGELAIRHPGPVVYVNEESGRDAMWRRLDALCRGRAVDRERLRAQLYVAPNKRVKLDDPGWQQELLAVGRELQPRLIAFDPLARMKAADRDENAQKDMAPLIEFVRQLRDETHAAAGFVHHTGHNGDRMRGASDLESVWETRLTWKREGQSPLVTIESEHREAEDGEPIAFRIGWDSETRSMRFDLAPRTAIDGRDLEAEILVYLAEHPHASTNAIATGLNAGKKTVADLLKQSPRFVAIPGSRGANLWLPSESEGSAGKTDGRPGPATSLPSAPLGAREEGSRADGSPTSLIDDDELDRLEAIHNDLQQRGPS